MAAKALQTVFSKNPAAKDLYGKAVGYAVFSNLKIALGGSLGGGSGVAVPKSGKRVYMKMGTAGIGFGIGGQKYQVVFLFETQEAFRSFVDKGWQAGTSAQAAAKDKGANVGAAFKNGIAFYQLTKKGLMASADISGTKYWKNDDLNR
jgi:lipid-binding SYLF domain-containing protein